MSHFGDGEFEGLGPLDETLPADGSGGSSDPADALEAELPADPRLREEVLRQRLAHALLLESGRAQAEREAGVRSLDAMLQNLPPRPQPHPGAWRILRGPMFLVAMLFVGVWIVNANRPAMDPKPLVEKVLVEIPTDELRDFRGRLTIATAEGETLLGGRIYWRTDGCFRLVPDQEDLEHVGCDGRRVWFGSPTDSTPRVFDVLKRARSIVPEAYSSRGLEDPMSLDLTGRIRTELKVRLQQLDPEGDPSIRVEPMPGDASRKILVTESLRVGMVVRSGLVDSIEFERGGILFRVEENRPVQLTAAAFVDPSTVPID